MSWAALNSQKNTKELPGRTLLVEERYQAPLPPPKYARTHRVICSFPLQKLSRINKK